MILSCNSCEKKFVVPDQAITSTGRTVQCGSCGNKWKQFPVKDKIKKTEMVKIPDKNKTKINEIIRSKKTKPGRKRVKKTREISLYSPEYLQKKHGINLGNIEINNTLNSTSKVNFGFYNSLILLIVLLIIISRGLYFFQDFVVEIFPYSKFYLDYFFENIQNMFEIFKNLITSY